MIYYMTQISQRSLEMILPSIICFNPLRFQSICIERVWCCEITYSNDGKISTYKTSTYQLHNKDVHYIMAKTLKQA